MTEQARSASVIRHDRPTPRCGQARTPRRADGRAPIRLTRRGRIVVTGAVALLIGAGSMVLAGAAQATGHAGGAALLGKGVTRVAIQPGQSLWSVAEASDPHADPRQVIQQIVQMNSLSGDRIAPGQLLWVPRG